MTPDKRNDARRGRKKRHLAEQTGIAPPLRNASSCVIGADCVGANESHVKLTSTLGSFWDKTHRRGGGFRARNFQGSAWRKCRSRWFYTSSLCRGMNTASKKVHLG